MHFASAGDVNANCHFDGQALRNILRKCNTPTELVTTILAFTIELATELFMP